MPSVLPPAIEYAIKINSKLAQETNPEGEFLYFIYIILSAKNSDFQQVKFRSKNDNEDGTH